MKNSLLYICVCVLFVVIISSCSRSNETFDDPKYLDFNAAVKESSQINLSELAVSLSYIPLETNDTVLLDEDIRLEITKEYIFVYDPWVSHEPVLFTNEGLYLNKIGKFGNGPGEMNPDFFSSGHCFVNPIARRIVFDNRAFRYLYSFDGNFIEKTDVTERLKKCISDSVVRNQTGLMSIGVMSYDNCLTVLNHQRVYVSDNGGDTFKEVGKAVNVLTVNQPHMYTIATPCNIFEDHSAIFDYDTGTYNRYFYNGKHCVAYIFKYGDGFKAVDGKYIVYRIYETDKYLIIDMSKNKFLFDKAADRLIRLNTEKGWFYNDIYPGLDFNIQGVTRDGKLYGLISADKFKEQAALNGDAELMELAGKVRDDDNPIVVIADMRN